MSNVKFSISCEDFEIILSFVYFMTTSMYRPNVKKAYRQLSKIKHEMKKYKNKGCDAVVKMCKEMRTTLYKNGEAIEKALIRFSNAVNEVVSDEVFYSVYSI